MWKKIFFVLFILAFLGGSLAYLFYDKIFNPNVVENLDDPLIYIPTGSTYEDVINILIEKECLIDQKSFHWVAKKMKYDQSEIKSGRFKLQSGWSNRQLINHLRLGKQEPVKLVINNVRTLPELFDLLGGYLEATPEQLRTYFTDPNFLDSTSYSSNTLLTHFIPNTYEVYWNTSPANLFNKLKKEKEKFWSTKDRTAKLKSKSLSVDEAYTLASILEKESTNNQEKPTIAGVYLNRIKRGIRLQADPTVVFAVGDFTINRVLHKHLAHPSPFNTYIHAGLPPGPICMPSVSSLEAVINAEDHNYIFFCAKPGYNREHAFAETSAEHGRNARKFHRWLDEQGIK